MATPRLVLVGPPGSGKTTIGRRLAHALSTELVDSDQLMEEAYQQSCADIYTQLGEEEFRQEEEKYVARALTTSGVVSLGGGAVISASTRALLRPLPVVYLRISAEEGVRRTAHLSTRPVLQDADPLARYQQILSQREHFYEEVASFSIHNDGKQPQRVVADILARVDGGSPC